VKNVDTAVECRAFTSEVVACIFEEEYLKKLKVTVMKTFTTTLLIILAATTISYSSNVIPESELSIITTASVELSVVNAQQKDFFQVAQYNMEMDALEFVTAESINYLQIFDESGKLKYQLPVMSNKLKISKKMFKQGTYKIGFITKENTTIQFTNLKVN